MLGKCIHWLINQLEKTISIRKDALAKRKPGALTHTEPKFLWVPILEKPYEDRLTTTREKFNSILYQAIKQAGGEHYILPRNKLSHRSFDMNGNLTHEGRKEYWRNFDEQILQFEFERANRRAAARIETQHAGQSNAWHMLRNQSHSLTPSRDRPLGSRPFSKH